MRGIRLKGHRKKTGGEGGSEDKGKKEKKTLAKREKIKIKHNEDKHTRQTGPRDLRSLLSYLL